MTVRELIIRLLDSPPDAEVVVNDSRTVRVTFGIQHRDKPKGQVQHVPTVFIEAK